MFYCNRDLERYAVAILYIEHIQSALLWTNRSRGMKSIRIPWSNKKTGDIRCVVLWMMSVQREGGHIQKKFDRIGLPWFSLSCRTGGRRIPDEQFQPQSIPVQKYLSFRILHLNLCFNPAIFHDRKRIRKLTFPQNKKRLRMIFRR